MNYPIYSTLLFLLLAPALPAQQPLGQPAKPLASAIEWRWWERHKQVTNQFPTNYRIGGLYRLKRDVVVERNSPDGRVSPYWLNLDDVEKVREWQRDPEGAKEREVQALRQALENKPNLSVGLDSTIRGIRRRRETRPILPAGTMLRFQQIWLERNFEMGEMVHPYAEILDGPLRGKWVDVEFLSDADYAHCDPKPQYLDYIP